MRAHQMFVKEKCATILMASFLWFNLPLILVVSVHLDVSASRRMYGVLFTSPLNIHSDIKHFFVQ